jgi:hypothetical protein
LFQKSSPFKTRYAANGRPPRFSGPRDTPPDNGGTRNDGGYAQYGGYAEKAVLRLFVRLERLRKNFSRRAPFEVKKQGPFARSSSCSAYDI